MGSPKLPDRNRRRARARTARVTAQHVADLAGVSKATVSYALNGTGSVSAETIARIEDCARRLGYRVNRQAAATRTGTTFTIGLVVPDLSNPFFPELVQEVHREAHRKGYSVFLVDSGQSLEMESEGIERLIEYQVDGLLWCPIKDEVVKELPTPMPLVVMDRCIEGFNNVYADTYRGGVIQAEFVLGKGHRRIGILSGPEWSPHAMLRNSGVHAGLQSQADVVWEYQQDYGFGVPTETAESILAGDATCVIAGNDIIAIDILKVYRQAGIGVPEEVSIIGFDDIQWAALVSPALTTVRLPKGRIGTRAVALLGDLIESDSESLKDIVLDVSLIERDSVRDLRVVASST